MPVALSVSFSCVGWSGAPGAGKSAQAADLSAGSAVVSVHLCSLRCSMKLDPLVVAPVFSGGGANHFVCASGAFLVRMMSSRHASARSVYRVVLGRIS